jgi:prevent-host-death family protein
MTTIGIRELGRETSRIVREVEETGRPALVTNHGRLAVAVVAIDPDALEDFVLGNAPDFVTDIRHADADLRAGRTRSASDVFAELENG